MTKKAETKKLDWVDEMIIWGCGLLHLQKHEKILRQLAKFVIAGVINTLIDWTIYYILCYWGGTDPIIAQLVSFTSSTLVSYYINTLWVFDTTKGKSRRRLVAEFFFFSACALGISTILLYIFIYKFGMGDMIAKVVVTAITMVFNYITRKLFLEDRKA